jgi:PKD repeat protein
LGDYIGLDFYGGVFHPCWADDSNSTGDNPDGTANLDYYTAAVTLVMPTVANFAGSPTNGVAPLAVTFTNLSTGTGLTNWLWTFGDGSFMTNAAGTNITHTYTNAGTYTVSLLVNGQAGANTSTKSGYVTALAPTVAKFSASPTNGIAPLTVTFTNLSTGTGLTNWLWGFGDGTSVTNANGANVVHTYTNSGNYNVSLVVGGQSGTSSVTVTNAIQVIPCLVAFSLQPTGRAAVVGSAVTFSAKASANGTQTNYLWFFQGNPIAGATNSALVLNNVQSTNFGIYFVQADNGICSASSSNAVLTSAVAPPLTIVGLTGPTLSLSVPTEIGPAYIVEFKTNLTDTVWATLTTLNGDGNAHVVTDSITNAPLRFYRIRVQ